MAVTNEKKNLEETIVSKKAVITKKSITTFVMRQSENG